MSEALISSLIVGISAGFASGYLGSLMVLEKMALVGDAMSHVALPGIALGILFNLPDPIIGGFAFLFVSAVLIWHVGRVTKLSFETIVGATFTLALAIGILLIPNSEALIEALFGDITTVTWLYAVSAMAISAVAILLTKTIYDKIVLTMISEELAISKGISVAKNNLLFLLLVSLVVAIGIKITGTLLVGFLVVVPAAAAKNISSNLFRYSLISGMFGIISACAGVLFAGFINQPERIPAGPLVVISGVVVFIVTVIMKWLSK